MIRIIDDSIRIILRCNSNLLISNRNRKIQITLRDWNSRVTLWIVWSVFRSWIEVMLPLNGNKHVGEYWCCCFEQPYRKLDLRTTREVSSFIITLWPQGQYESDIVCDVSMLQSHTKRTENWLKRTRGLFVLYHCSSCYRPENIGWNEIFLTHAELTRNCNFRNMRDVRRWFRVNERLSMT